METKIIKAVFGGGTSTVTNKRTRTDYGQVLEIIGIDLPDTFECIFSNSATSAGTGKKMIGSNQRCLIPDEYLATGQTIYAWILLHDTEDDGRHMYSVRIPVADMPDTSPEEPTPVEQSVISQAITALNSAVTTTSQKAQEATESADRAEQAAEGAEGYAERAESAQQAAESARDRATQAETSARTSAATASEKASEAISSATTASQSALTAETASESARASATASAESASQASASASTASTKAQEASGYASSANTSEQTASQKASEAVQSASTAVQAKTDAETAKRASETAQGLAESARDNAITAKNDAESARDEAQEIVDGITGKVEQIDSNTDRIESLEDDRYKPYAVDTASGAVASFPDGADGIPLKSCIVRVDPVQAGSGDPSPDNIRPISGWTGCEVQRTGINLFDGEMESGDYDVTETRGGAKRSNNNRMRCANFIPVKPNTAYYVRSSYSNGTAVFYDDKKWMQPNGFSAARNNIITTPSWCRYMTFYYNGTEYNNDISINYPATDTEYHDYKPSATYPITFPSEAGIVYGAHVDVVNGELVVDRAIFNVVGSNDFSITQYDTYTAVQFIDYQRYGGVNNVVFDACDKFVCSKPNEKGLYKVWNSNLGVRMWFGLPPEITTVDEAKAWFAENPTQIVAKVVEQSTHYHVYPLTPTGIKTLLGQNNIWADCGDTSVTYRADTTLYISRLTEPDADMVADSNIVSGQYFMVGTDLYKATANIASGASVIVGTNATKISLAQALNEINA